MVSCGSGCPGTSLVHDTLRQPLLKLTMWGVCVAAVGRRWAGIWPSDLSFCPAESKDRARSRAGGISVTGACVGPGWCVLHGQQRAQVARGQCASGAGQHIFGRVSKDSQTQPTGSTARLKVFPQGVWTWDIRWSDSIARAPSGVRVWGQASPSGVSWHYLLNAFNCNRMA